MNKLFALILAATVAVSSVFAEEMLRSTPTHNQAERVIGAFRSSAGDQTFYAAAVTNTAGLYSRPTANQLERMIGAVKEANGDAAAYTFACTNVIGLYSYPTLDQVERLIATIRSYTNGTGAATHLTTDRYEHKFKISGTAYSDIYSGTIAVNNLSFSITNRVPAAYADLQGVSDAVNGVGSNGAGMLIYASADATTYFDGSAYVIGSLYAKMSWISASACMLVVMPRDDDQNVANLNAVTLLSDTVTKVQ